MFYEPSEQAGGELQSSKYAESHTYHLRGASGHLSSLTSHGELMLMLYIPPLLPDHSLCYCSQEQHPPGLFTCYNALRAHPCYRV